MGTDATEEATRVWVLAQAGPHAVALPSSHIREMVTLERAPARPMVRPEIRGFINLRGQILALYDLRYLLGEPSAQTEVDALCALLGARKADHERWIDALEGSLRDNTPFGLARDPAKCAFGQWYATFKTDNAVVRHQLSKIDAPHRAIHALADTALALLQAGRREAALAALDATRGTTLAQLMRLLDETAEVVRSEHREIVLVLDRSDAGVGVLVDAVSSVRAIEASQIRAPEGDGLGQGAHALVGFASIDHQEHLLLDLDRLLAGHLSDVTAAPGSEPPAASKTDSAGR